MVCWRMDGATFVWAEKLEDGGKVDIADDSCHFDVDLERQIGIERNLQSECVADIHLLLSAIESVDRPELISSIVPRASAM